MARQRRRPSTRVRMIGRVLNGTVARWPVLWPLIRPAMRSYFDGLAAGWDERVQAGSVEYMLPLATAVTAIRGEPERILDIGTGTGAAALFLAREYPRARVRGVDLSERMIAAARAKVGLDPEGRVAFKVADAALLPFPDASFDLITHVNVPPHFAEIARLLRPDGHVIFVASSGPATPFYTPDAVLERGLRRRGIEPLASGQAGAGTYLIGRARAE